MASLSRAPGYPDYSSTSTSKFSPQIWAGKFLEKFYEATVLAFISNTDFEGEIKDQGDSVVINSLPDIEIYDYYKGMNLNYERPESPAVILNIDNGKYFGIILDDVDKIQSKLPLLNKFAEVGSEKMKIKIDTHVLGNIYADADAYNKGLTAGKKSGDINLGVSGTPLGITSTNVIDTIIDCGTVLDEQDIPETGRWIVIPAWMAGRLKKSELKDASLTGDGESALRNGRLGMIDRFTIYKSNLLTQVTDGSDKCWHLPFGHKVGLTFASQIVKTEKLRAERTFGDIVRGLNVYGFKVTLGTAIGDLYVKKG